MKGRESIERKCMFLMLKYKYINHRFDLDM